MQGERYERTNSHHSWKQHSRGMGPINWTTIIMKLKPTAREIRVVCQSLGIDPTDFVIFNDIRENGGRIKIWNRQMSFATMDQIAARIGILFPRLVIECYSFKSASTVITYKYH